MLSEWAKRLSSKPTLRVASGAKQLSQVWQELDSCPQRVDCVRYDGSHGGLVQITAPTDGDAWVELCPARSGARPEYPCTWKCNAQVNIFINPSPSTPLEMASIRTMHVMSK